jgi:ABC-type polar amino acid transport system ATPase subunit
MTMIIATHQMMFAQHVANRAVFMDEGQIVEIAPPIELVAHPREQRTRRFMGRILYGMSPQQDVAKGHGDTE